MFDLKPLSKDAIPAALAKAERYRLLNESEMAQSICEDVLAVDWDLDTATLNGVTARIKGSSDYGSCSSLRSAVGPMSSSMHRASAWVGRGCSRW